MSITNIPNKVAQLLMAHAAGRCEYRGCNKDVTQDFLTKQRGKYSCFAHIIADKPKGPRGDETLSEALKADISNLMVLCFDHHKLIDYEDVAGHSVDRLRGFKAEHEKRIRELTAITEQHRTHLILFEGRIGARPSQIDLEQARCAALPRYPICEEGLRLDLSQLSTGDDVDSYFKNGVSEVDCFVLEQLRPRMNRSDVHHLSIFALASIPLLVYFGKTVGDIIPSTAFQKLRVPDTWSWQDDNSSLDIEIRSSINESFENSACSNHVALLYSVSDNVQLSAVESCMTKLDERKFTHYEIRLSTPAPDRVRSEAHLNELTRSFIELLAEIRGRHGQDCVVHLFAAIPNSLAVRIGQRYLPKAHPPIVVYEHCQGVMRPVIKLLDTSLPPKIGQSEMPSLLEERKV